MQQLAVLQKYAVYFSCYAQTKCKKFSTAYEVVLNIMVVLLCHVATHSNKTIQ
jgi:hypothetical protein